MDQAVFYRLVSTNFIVTIREKMSIGRKRGYYTKLTFFL